MHITRLPTSLPPSYAAGAPVVFRFKRCILTSLPPTYSAVATVHCRPHTLPWHWLLWAVALPTSLPPTYAAVSTPAFTYLRCRGARRCESSRVDSSSLYHQPITSSPNCPVTYRRCSRSPLLCVATRCLLTSLSYAHHPVSTAFSTYLRFSRARIFSLSNAFSSLPSTCLRCIIFTYLQPSFGEVEARRRGLPHVAFDISISISSLRLYTTFYLHTLPSCLFLCVVTRCLTTNFHLLTLPSLHFSATYFRCSRVRHCEFSHAVSPLPCHLLTLQFHPVVVCCHTMRPHHLPPAYDALFSLPAT